MNRIQLTFTIVCLFVPVLNCLQVGQERALPSREQHPAPEPYSFSYSAESTGALSSHQESGDGSGRVTGFYTIQGDDGRQRRVDYVADENGYRASVKTNEVGTRSQSSADARYQTQLPSAKQLEAAKISLDDYKYYEHFFDLQRNKHLKTADDQRQQLLFDQQPAQTNPLRPAFVSNENYLPLNRLEPAPGGSQFRRPSEPQASITTEATTSVNQYDEAPNAWRSSGKLQPSNELPLNPVVVQPSQVVAGTQFRLYPEIKNNPIWQQQQLTPSQAGWNGQRAERKYATILQKQLEDQYKQQANSLANQDYPRTTNSPLLIEDSQSQSGSGNSNNNFITGNQRPASVISSGQQETSVNAGNSLLAQQQPAQAGDFLQQNQQQQSNIINEQNEYNINEAQEVPQLPVGPKVQQAQIPVQQVSSTTAIKLPTTSTISPGLVSINLNESDELQTDRPVNVNAGQNSLDQQVSNVNQQSQSLGPLEQQQPQQPITTLRPQYEQNLFTQQQQQQTTKQDAVNEQRPTTVEQQGVKTGRQQLVGGQAITKLPNLVEQASPEVVTTTPSPLLLPSTTQAPLLFETTRPQFGIRPTTVTTSTPLVTLGNRPTDELESFFNQNQGLQPQQQPQPQKAVVGGTKSNFNFKTTISEFQQRPFEPTLRPLSQVGVDSPAGPQVGPSRVDYSSQEERRPATEVFNNSLDQQQAWRGIKTVRGKTSLPNNGNRFWQNNLDNNFLNNDWRQQQQQLQNPQPLLRQSANGARILNANNQAASSKLLSGQPNVSDYARAFGFGIRSSRSEGSTGSGAASNSINSAAGNKVQKQ